MAGALMQLHHNIRPIGSVEGIGGQFPHYFLHRGDSGLVRVHPYSQQTIISSPCHFILCLHQEKSDVMAEFLFLPPSLKAIQGRQFCLGMAGELEPL